MQSLYITAVLKILFNYSTGLLSNPFLHISCYCFSHNIIVSVSVWQWCYGWASEAVMWNHCRVITGNQPHQADPNRIMRLQNYRNTILRADTNNYFGNWSIVRFIFLLYLEMTSSLTKTHFRTERFRLIFGERDG